MQIYLGLGSNLGDRRHHLEQALALLRDKGLRIQRVSPVVETPALLPELAPADWNRQFLNLALECETDCSPQQLRQWIVEIQAGLGRRDQSHWSPRPIDIDILLWGREIIATEELTIPHPQLHRRGFVLTPMIALAPRLTVPGLGDKTLLDWSLELPLHIPLWMGVLNLTPDSFSDGGRYTDWDALQARIAAMVEAGVHIIDVGGESTRPGAEPVAEAEEWRRIAPVLEALHEQYAPRPLRPLVSVDTYHPGVARRALEAGVDMINDVSGLRSPAMLELARDGGSDWVAMHSLTVPADREVTLPTDLDPCTEVQRWLLERLEEWDAAGLDLNRIVFDPGIGFGKNALQSLELLRHAGLFRRHGLRSLIGHSRKSFMASFSEQSELDKDLVTLGASLRLCQQGVDIVRIHNVPLHASAYRGWAHLVA